MKEKIKIKVVADIHDNYDVYGNHIKVSEVSLLSLIEKFGLTKDTVVFIEDNNQGYYHEDYDSSSVYLAAYYYRDETDEEYEDRMIKEEKYRLRKEVIKQKRDLKKATEKELAQLEFERLKKTYGFQ